MAKVYVITGPAGVGKSTISVALSQKLEKSVVLEGDEIYHQVKNGSVKPWQEGNHLDLMWKNLLCLTQNYLEAGFDVIINYIVYKDVLDVICKKLAAFEIHFVVLMANIDVVKLRDQSRGEEFAVNRANNHISKFLSQGYNSSSFLYNDNLSVEKEVNLIISGRFKL